MVHLVNIFGSGEKCQKGLGLNIQNMHMREHARVDVRALDTKQGN